MENENITTVDSTSGNIDSDTQVSEQPDANAELRAYNKRLKDENAQLRKVAMRAELNQIGLSPDEGLGVAIVETYDGAISAEAISAYAAEKYRYQTSQAPLPPSVTAAQRVEQVQAVSESVTPPPVPNPVEEAEAKLVSEDATREDAIRSLTVKAQQFSQR